MSGSTKKVVAIDFDNTISHGHVHAILWRKFSFESIKKLTGAEFHAAWEEVKNIPLKEVEGSGDWEKFISELLDEGYEVVIASFSEYPSVLKKFMNEKIFKGQEKFNKVKFVTGYRTLDGNPPKNKNDHILEIAKIHAITDYKNIFLIDDTKDNTQDAKEKLRCHAYHLSGIPDFDVIKREIVSAFSTSAVAAHPSAAPTGGGTAGAGAGATRKHTGTCLVFNTKDPHVISRELGTPTANRLCLCLSHSNENQLSLFSEESQKTVAYYLYKKVDGSETTYKARTARIEDEASDYNPNGYMRFNIESELQSTDIKTQLKLGEAIKTILIHHQKLPLDANSTLIFKAFVFAPQELGLLPASAAGFFESARGAPTPESGGAGAGAAPTTTSSQALIHSAKTLADMQAIYPSSITRPYLRLSAPQTRLSEEKVNSMITVVRPEKLNLALSVYKKVKGDEAEYFIQGPETNWIPDRDYELCNVRTEIKIAPEKLRPLILRNLHLLLKPGEPIPENISLNFLEEFGFLFAPSDAGLLEATPPSRTAAVVAKPPAVAGGGAAGAGAGAGAAAAAAGSATSSSISSSANSSSRFTSSPSATVSSSSSPFSSFSSPTTSPSSSARISSSSSLVTSSSEEPASSSNFASNSCLPAGVVFLFATVDGFTGCCLEASFPLSPPIFEDPKFSSTCSSADASSVISSLSFSANISFMLLAKFSSRKVFALAIAVSRTAFASAMLSFNRSLI